MSKNFSLVKTLSEGHARAGELVTRHGVIPTPVFMPVGSQATVKTLTPEDIKEIGYGMVLANTYHLYLRPGIDIIKKMGGLHRFMAWDGAILTDSGGFQVFSLSPLAKVSDEGVTFRSHIDGSEHFLTPEAAVQYQEALGSDIAMVLDQCTAYGKSYEDVKTAMDRTHRWAEQCLKAKRRDDQLLFAIVQGGVFKELRHESAISLTTSPFDGYAVGGMSVGEPKEKTFDIVHETVTYLPATKPRYLMGVGSPEDIVECVARGIDMFDCALPTRVARNGAFFTWQGRRNIRNAVFSTMETPVDPVCKCYTCRTFSAAYLHHLFRCEELLAYRLATIHNLTFFKDLMSKIREAILGGTFEVFRDSFLANYKTTDEPTRLSQKQKWLKSREQNA